MATSLVSTGVQFPDDSIQARADGFPAGTKMLFQQTTAPTGWTKVTTGIDNRALRVVTGNVGAAGANPFTGSFNSTVNTVAAGAHNHTVSVSPALVPAAALGSHTHTNRRHSFTYNPDDSTNLVGFNPLGALEASTNTSFLRSATFANGAATFATGGNGTHTHGASTAPHAGHAHGFNLNVLHIDIIVATRN